MPSVPLPLLLAAAGGTCLLGAALVLRSLGRAYRVGRLLAASPSVSIAEAVGLARAGRPAYVKLIGRITSTEVFPDEHDRPLVFRRTRLLVSEHGRWQVLSDDREAVPFGIESRTEYIAIDQSALDEGLIVIPREAEGTAADIGAAVDPATPADAPAKLVIDQVSAVEQATVAGVPILGADGEPRLAAGLGRPLIMTTLEIPAAMRILTAGRRRRVVSAAGLLTAGAILLAAALGVLLAGAFMPPAALAADPSPVLIDPLDPRAGAGASRVGDALAALAVVLILGIGAAALTYLYVRLNRPRGRQ
jgi:hypothetical protein